jgi:tRNA pseudouridine38-40 synthase
VERYFLEFSYFGKEYCGWQRQPETLSVQEVMEKAISALLREDIKLVGAGRTDTGVHSKQMFAHFDSNTMLKIRDVKHRLNLFLPKDIAVHNLYEVHQNAHARFDAVARTYEYWLHTVKNPFLTAYSYYFYQYLDVEKMNQAAKMLLEYTDFECFSKKNTTVKTYLCKIVEADWKQDDEKLIFTITSDRFLRNMVRAIVGTLLEVGVLKLTLEDVKKIIESKQRINAGVSVPAHGLYLVKVVYPSGLFKDNE